MELIWYNRKIWYLYWKCMNIYKKLEVLIIVKFIRSRMSLWYEKVGWIYIIEK